jgi:hypothetical protein
MFFISQAQVGARPIIALALRIIASCQSAFKRRIKSISTLLFFLQTQEIGLFLFVGAIPCLALPKF